eukprot:s425_g26.t1
MTDRTEGSARREGWSETAEPPPFTPPISPLVTRSRPQAGALRAGHEEMGEGSVNAHGRLLTLRSLASILTPCLPFALRSLHSPQARSFPRFTRITERKWSGWTRETDGVCKGMRYERE